MAVGGYGRGELCPFSDLDVVLVHRGKGDVSATADRIWYPVWDEGISLDHSVRRPSEALDMAGEDLRVALGLLDGRVICGDAKVAEPMLEGARDRWAKQKPPWLRVLADLVAERHRSYGDVGFLLEPDLKEAHGGLRDVAALTALMLAVPVLADYVDTVAIDDARCRPDLDPGRAAPPGGTGAEQAAASGAGPGGARARLSDDSDALMLTVATAGRTVAWEGDDAWRRRGAWSRQQDAPRGLRRSRSRRGSASGADGAVTVVPGTPDIGVTDDEVVLTEAADCRR